MKKIFCIGFNKTGTTSLEKALIDFGYQMGNQPTAENLLYHYVKGNWAQILAYCESANAFQDTPFSLPNTWKVLINRFPEAKFILTYRSEEDWYASITKFHSKRFGGGKRIPNKADLKNATYIEQGWMWHWVKGVFNAPDSEPYKKEILCAVYRQHNEEILEYFKGNDNFLAIDPTEHKSYAKLCEFLGQTPLYEEFPHLNKTNK